MFYEISLYYGSLAGRQAMGKIMECNARTSEYGLILSPEQAKALIDTRSRALAANGRIEFGGGVIEKLIYEFSDSPYLTPDNYETTLHDLIEIFYETKSETLDLISDDELIKLMAEIFSSKAQGSTELLAGFMSDFARRVRFGNRDGSSSDDVGDMGGGDPYEGISGILDHNDN